MKVFGLTGGIASGKSTVANLLKKAGIPVIDADTLARQVVEPGSPGLKQVIDRFGQDYLLPDGSLDRKKLGQTVFKNLKDLKDLEGITHPLVGAKLQEELALLAQAGHQFAVYEAPLIFEKNIDKWLDGTILIVATQSQQIERLKQRDQMPKKEALARISSQMPASEKAKRAEAIVTNDGSLLHLANELRAAFKKLSGQDIDFANFL